MPYLISDLKNDLERKLHGTTLDKLSDPDSLIYEAARNLLLKVDPMETRRVANIENALYANAFRYTVPEDLKGKKIIDIRPQTNREWWDHFYSVYGVAFDRYRADQTFTVEFESGTKYLRAARSLPQGPLFAGLTDVTDNGTWVAGGVATNVRQDTLNTIYGTGSLRFDISGTGAAYVENTTLTDIDLTTYLNIGAMFLDVYMPTVTGVASVDLRWGESTTKYWNKTVTAAHDGTAFKVGWNKLRFDWQSATKTSTPDVTLSGYSRITVNYTGAAVTDFRVNQMVMELGKIYEIVYYSKYLFRSSAGVWKEKPTAEDDIVNLDTDSYNLLLYECDFLAAQELQGEDTVFDYKFWERKEADVYADYMSQNKSEVTKPSGTYYRMPGRTRSQRFGSDLTKWPY